MRTSCELPPPSFSYFFLVIHYKTNETIDITYLDRSYSLTSIPTHHSVSHTLKARSTFELPLSPESLFYSSLYSNHQHSLSDICTKYKSDHERNEDKCDSAVGTLRRGDRPLYGEKESREIPGQRSEILNAEKSSEC